MSKNTVHFTISNPAISFLLHDCVKSPHNQTGFLFGEIHRKVSNVTTDSHSNNETVEITVSITATLPFSESEDLLFSKDGTLNEVLLDTILGEFKADVVGWYSFTRNQDLSQSLCQLFLAHHFSNYFSHIPKQLFLFFRISTNVVFEENFTYTNKFLCTTGSDISTPVELHIRQLGESTHEYNAHKPVTKHSQIFDTVLNTLEWNSKDIVSSYENLQSLLCDKLLEQIDHVPTKNSNPMTNDIEDNHMQVSPEPELAEDDPMDASGGDAPSPQPQGNPSTLTPPHQTNSKPNKSKPEGRIVPSNKLQLHAPTTTGRGSSRPGTFGVMRPGRIPNQAVSPAAGPGGVRTPIRTASPSPHRTGGVRHPTPRNGTTPTQRGPRQAHPPARKPNPTPVTQKVKILSRKSPLPGSDSPELINVDTPPDIELDKSRDTYSSQEY